VKTEQLERELRHEPEETMDETATFPDERLGLISPAATRRSHSTPRSD
jgi:hypothetical protein